MLGAFWAYVGFFVAGGFAGYVEIIINQSNNMRIFDMYFCVVVCGWLLFKSSIFMRMVK